MMAASNTTIGITEGAGKLVATRTVDSAHCQKICIGGAEDGESLVNLPAHDAADAGAPLKIGGRASLALPTAVSADGDRVNARFTREGALATVSTQIVGKVFVDGQGLTNLQSTTSNATLGASSASGVTAGGSGLKVYVTSVSVVCSTFANAGYVTLRDGSGGSDIYQVGGITAVNTGNSIAAAGNGFLCSTSLNTALHVFYSGASSNVIRWSLTYYYAP
jgi:hypothetical protein